jgi:hypothetical protein
MTDSNTNPEDDPDAEPEHEIDVPDDVEKSDDPSEIDEMITQCDDALEVMQDRLHGRIRSPENERVRCQIVGNISTMLRTKKQLIEMREIEELADEIMELREAVEREHERANAEER